MNCWHCKTELIWGGDHEEEGDSGELFLVSSLSCPNCKAEVLVYLSDSLADVENGR
jgi:uncharacterized protein YbaR (Trm112 family)